MVGDTVADLKMGRLAGLRATVGVLTGVGNVISLKEYSDYFVNILVLFFTQTNICWTTLATFLCLFLRRLTRIQKEVESLQSESRRSSLHCFPCCLRRYRLYHCHYLNHFIIAVLLLTYWHRLN
ncbi:hypothetical protein DICVIV_07079 [Dictyocaulus viviparus]|uniref:Uncharacterized protein n=1 Tax=Dictyocaulus viviparus TaxID=29172 RepID=A0A0D8XSR7_DICVI|nr:hypothetical protein DICVIV_07079 [Dictyocaulus viviparus]